MEEGKDGRYIGEKGNNDVCNIYTKLGSPPPCPRMNSNGDEANYSGAPTL